MAHEIMVGPASALPRAAKHRSPRSTPRNLSASTAEGKDRRFVVADIVVFGAGKMAQMAKVYIDRHGPDRIVGFTVDAAFKQGDSFEGHPLVTWEELESHFPPTAVKLLGPLTPKRLNTLRRDRFYEGLARNYEFSSFIHPDSHFYADAIGRNCFILENTVIQPFVSIGDNVIIWSGNIIGHHVTMGNHCFMSSQSGIAGGSRIGEQCFIGAQVGIGPGVTIGDRCVLLNGAGIDRDLPDETVIVGHVGVRGEIQPFPSSRMRHLL
jgi:sugar O-acyltransferase (sialic acid O-acetyltransferase NeuD family)